jgi:hypothetical protein
MFVGLAVVVLSVAGGRGATVRRYWAQSMYSVASLVATLLTLSLCVRFCCEVFKLVLWHLGCFLHGPCDAQFLWVHVFLWCG